jgi:hypothetical protein
MNAMHMGSVIALLGLAMESTLRTKPLGWRICMSSTSIRLSLRDNLISTTELAALKFLLVPAAGLLLYKPVERTNSVFDKVSELLRIGQSQTLLNNGENDTDDSGP